LGVVNESQATMIQELQDEINRLKKYEEIHRRDAVMEPLQKQVTVL
jgi:hypothetical protein